MRASWLLARFLAMRRRWQTLTCGRRRRWRQRNRLMMHGFTSRRRHGEPLITQFDDDVVGGRRKPR